jgi:hypothetical protein
LPFERDRPVHVVFGGWHSGWRMSSLAATQADGYYNPPDWDPTKQSRRALTKSKGANQFEQKGLVRFEMPFDVWCTGCARATAEEVAAGTACSSGKEQHIGRGVRFDALKVRHGKYFSTVVWEFRMKCHMCYHPIRIRTDPQHCDFELVEGVRRKTKEYEAGNEDGLVELPSAVEQAKAVADPFYKLERTGEQKRKVSAQREGFDALVVLQGRGRDDYALNKLARKRFKRGGAGGAAAAPARAAAAQQELEQADRLSAASTRFHMPSASKQAALQRQLALRTQGVFRQPTREAALAAKAQAHDIQLRHFRAPGGDFGGAALAHAPPLVFAVKKKKKRKWEGDEKT